ncbi:hypothetical protein AB0M94_36590 [Streptomyces xanthochromogenes]|uniref:hypothetical protein n=1 Tax=Streptomyces xanthochromogenes TaxID=67384 RepID=UPI003416737F
MATVYFLCGVEVPRAVGKYVKGVEVPRTGGLGDERIIGMLFGGPDVGIPLPIAVRN